MGPVLVLLSAFGFATLGVFGKLAFQSGFDRNAALFFRFVGALPLLAIVLRFAKPARPDFRVLFKATILGFVGIGVEASLFFITLEHLGAALTGVFLYLYPAFVVILSHFFLREKMSRKKMFCVAVALIGSVLTAGVLGDGDRAMISPLRDIPGLIAGFLTGAWYAVYLLAGARVTGRGDPLWVSSGVVLGSSLVFGILMLTESAWAKGGLLPDLGPSWYPVIGLSVFSTVLPFTTLFAGMKRVGPIRASLLSTFELVFTLVLATAVLDEKLTLWQIFGAFLILLSVVITARDG
jgi:drug/metabolite transporter (DMT)-like permease